MKEVRVRLRIRCTGAVQGVGFRPTVHRVATELGLGGRVINDPGGATVEIEGPPATVERFVDRLPKEMPPLARLDRLDVEGIEPLGESTFKVDLSVQGPRSGALVPPDAVLCDDCRCEMEDPSDRRHRYPFTTCTNCGPRFSLVRRLPYDRATTAMACFELCPECAREYADPGDRRFHAEPVCCPACGPRLWLASPRGSVVAEGSAALESSRQALLAGSILAVKGLGGFQLACRADRAHPVATLRTRKRRPTKPFAVMARDLEGARELVELSEADERLVTSPRCPVVLAPARTACPVVEDVAPGLEDLGVLLPTTPLHVELFRNPEMPPLVMTSGNRSEEPICRGNREASRRLADLADLLLLHDRDVIRRVDDSVVRSSPIGPIVIRRARGWVPEPLELPVPTPEPILAVGGHLQVTACIAVGDQAFPSQHVGDLDSESARLFLREVIAGLEDFLQASPRIVAADVHPDYPSRAIADEMVRERAGELLEVQHHLAHAAAVLAEHGRFPDPDERVIGLSLDGTGFGTDGTAWGGEWLSLDGSLRWRRLAHLEPLPLVGGEAAVRGPWRVAAAALARGGGDGLLDRLPLADLVPPERLHEVARLARSDGWPMASGAGRLFEACGALLGLVADNTWEGEAAVRLESLAARARSTASWNGLALREVEGGILLPSSDLLVEAAKRIEAGEPAAAVAAGFHATFCDLAAAATGRVGEGGVVAVGGGCMVNRLLVGGLRDRLQQAGFEPLLAARVPPGDGGLAYGQVVLATVSRARGVAIDAELR